LRRWAARGSDAAAAAFALVHQVAAMLFIPLRIVGAGIPVVVAQVQGGGRRDQADAVARAVLGASRWIGGKRR
jgi:Na+-driven multidrug efflux pump